MIFFVLNGMLTSNAEVVSRYMLQMWAAEERLASSNCIDCNELEREFFGEWVGCVSSGVSEFLGVGIVD